MAAGWRCEMRRYCRRRRYGGKRLYWIIECGRQDARKHVIDVDQLRQVDEFVGMLHSGCVRK